jgi:KDO2-lipid IV(A) lauroyltransferase
MSFMPWWTRFFANAIGLIFWLIPWSWRRGFARWFSWLWFDVLRFRRYTVLKNLTIAFPEKSKTERYQIARESIGHLALNFCEFVSLPWVSPEFANTKVIFHGLENYEKAHQAGKGKLLLSLHAGNGDYACAMMSLRGIRLHLISKKFKLKAINDFWFGVRESMGTRFIDPHGSRNAFEIFGAFKRNESVVFVLDQFMGKPYGIETRFFGRKSGTAYGLALFAVKTHAPVIPVFTYRDVDNVTHVVFEPEIPLALPRDSQDRDLQIAKTTQQYNDWIESVVRRFPGQWMWIHRRWKKWE